MKNQCAVLLWARDSYCSNVELVNAIDLIVVHVWTGKHTED